MGTYTIQQCQTALEAVSTSKTNIKNAIVAKGVAVPDGTPLSDYAAKVAAIQVFTDMLSATGDTHKVFYYYGDGGDYTALIAALPSGWTATPIQNITIVDPTSSQLTGNYEL